MTSKRYYYENITNEEPKHVKGSIAQGMMWNKQGKSRYITMQH
jgi:hypothetical protein